MRDTAIDTILEHAEAGAVLRQRFFAENAQKLARLALRMALTLARGNKILFCGNGGSAADCQHLAAEFVNRYQMDRPPLAAIALTTDSSILTSIGNDFGFELAYAKQVQALGLAGDMLVGLSTSGNSGNIMAALEAARARNLYTTGMTGAGGGKMANLCDTLVAVEDKRTPLIQELHISAGHLLCGLTDYYLFENVSALAPYLDGSKSLDD
jgi:D-sedoheptulose 7-phosphate isomerase